MPRYYRRYSKFGRRGRNGRRRNKKVSVYTKKGARSQARQIWKNQSQITAIQRKMKDTYTRNFYELTGANSEMVKPGAVFPLINPTGWARIFNTQPDNIIVQPTHCRMGNIHLRGAMSIEAGTTVVSCDVYILQLQDSTAAVTRDNLGSDLSGLMQTSTTTGEGVWNNYYYNWYGSAGLEGPYGLQLNPEAFKIRGYRRFMLGDVAESGTAVSDGADVTNIKDANKRFEFKLRHPIKLENPLGQNTSGQSLTWKTMTVDQVAAHKQLYLAVFVNAVEGTEVFLNWNATLSVTEPN